jgi:hypothetical protein
MTAEGRPTPGAAQEPDVPWAAYGLTPGDLSGWSVAPERATDPAAAVNRVAELALTVRSPVALIVRDGRLAVAGESRWEQRIALIDSRLVWRLPLVAMDGRRVLVAPPSVPLDAVEPRCSEYARADGELEIIWDLRSTDRLDIGIEQPIARILPMADAQLANLQSGGLALRVWRLHPDGVRIEPAERTLAGRAPSAAMRWCGPYAHANSYGFWVFAPVDLDIMWIGGRTFEQRWQTLYSDADAATVSRLQRPGDRYRYVPRRKVAFGTPTDAAVSIWSGCILQTPPGWGLMIRSPVNIASSPVFSVQEAILETDWLPYDIWINLEFVQQRRWAQLRRSEGWPPIAQLLPVPRLAYDDAWQLNEGPLERTSAAGEDLVARWLDYNHAKWNVIGEKDPRTYHRQRAAAQRRGPAPHAWPPRGSE